MKHFNSGMVAMDVDLEKTGFCQGEGPPTDTDTHYPHNKACFDMAGVFCRRGNNGRCLHSEQLVSSNQAQVLFVP